jgi:hypothetical protein
MQANSYVSPGTAGGNREDLRDILTILEPEETPFTSMVKKADSPKSTFVEVLADTLRKPRTTGTREGQDAGKGNNKAAQRQRFGAYVHRVQDEFGVTDVQQAISQHGGVAAVSDEYAQAKAKCIREMKRDIEAIACSDVEMQGGSDTDMRTRGAFKWLDSSAQGTQPVPANFRPSTNVILSGVSGVNAFTEVQLNAILRNLSKVYGGKRDYEMLAGDNFVETVDNFTRTNTASDQTKTRYQVHEMANTHEITLRVSVFDSSFGRVKVMPTQFNKLDSNGDGDPNTALILNMNLWQMLFLEQLHSVDQEENAGGQSGYAKAMFALLCLNPKGNGKMFNT